MRKTLLAGVALIAIQGIVPTASASPLTFSYSGSIVDYTIPTTGLYDITAAGAQGGSGGQLTENECTEFPPGPCTITTTLGGLGAVISGKYLLAAGDELEILAGGQGGSGTIGGPPYVPNVTAGSGGGGSFVALVSSLSPVPVPLVVAGGGGGGGAIYPGFGGLTTQDGGGSHGGTDGNGGGYDLSSPPLYGYWAATSSGGGGYYTDGASGDPFGSVFSHGDNDQGGASFLNGGAGGFPGGGFGGGGEGLININGGSGAGGGGYSGGDDGVSTAGGGFGGGSYLDPSALDPVLTAAANSGDGYVTLDLIRRIKVPEPGSLALFAPALLGLLALRRRGRA